MLWYKFLLELEINPSSLQGILDEIRETGAIVEIVSAEVEEEFEDDDDEEEEEL